MQTAAKVLARPRTNEDAPYQLAGMLVVSLFPALFWTLAIAGVGSAVGHTPSPAALMVFGTAIAAFCATIFHALLIRR